MDDNLISTFTDVKFARIFANQGRFDFGTFDFGQLFEKLILIAFI